MIEKVCQNPEIYSIYVPLPDNPLKNLNCRVLLTGGRPLVIDTGFRRKECDDALNEGLAELGLEKKDVALFLTHLHSDHTGLAESFAEAGCPIYMSAVDHEYISHARMSGKWYDRFLEYGFSQEEVDAQFKRNPAIVYAAQSVFPVTPVQDGETFTISDVTFQCIGTPGHTPGHTCLYIPDKEIMFLGDHVLFDITPNITVWPGVDNSLKNYLTSLDKIAAYPMQLALPAHRGNDMDVYERIDQIKRHHAERLQNTLDIIGAHPDKNVYEIASYMKWSMRGKDWSEFPVQQKYFAVGETVAHLDYLKAEGRITEQHDGSMYRYRLV